MWISAQTNSMRNPSIHTGGAFQRPSSASVACSNPNRAFTLLQLDRNRKDDRTPLARLLQEIPMSLQGRQAGIAISA
jgi:hypothetical protein